MSTLDKKLKRASFWIRLGAINHSIALAVIAFGCVYSGFSCKGESMKGVLSTYAFTLFTPQIALEVILLVAIFMVSNSLRDLRENFPSLVLFILTFALLIMFTYQ